MKPFIDPAFWSDPDIEGAKAGIKLTLLWLITNSRTNLLGICGASAKRFEFETGLPEKALDEAVKALPRAIQRFGDDIYVKNYVRHQFGSGAKLIRNNFFVALSSLFVSIRNDDLRSSILTSYPEFNEAQKGFEGLTKPKDSTGRERTGKGTKFEPPTTEQAITYGAEIGMKLEDIEGWHDHFTSNGWRIGGKAPMRDWKSALRNAKRHPLHNGNGTRQRPHPNRVDRNVGTANEGKSSQYAGIGKV